MKYTTLTYDQTGDLKTIIESISVATKSPEDVLANLNRLGIDSYITETGDLLIRYWQIGAENFVNPEQAAIIRTAIPIPDQSDNMDWLSRNLQSIREEYSGKWIAVHNDIVVGSASSLPDLIDQIAEYDRPLVTFIPTESVVWNFTYAL